MWIIRVAICTSASKSARFLPWKIVAMPYVQRLFGRFRKRVVLRDCRSKVLLARKLCFSLLCLLSCVATCLSTWASSVFVLLCLLSCLANGHASNNQKTKKHQNSLHSIQALSVHSYTGLFLMQSKLCMLWLIFSFLKTTETRNAYAEMLLLNFQVLHLSLCT